MSAPPPGGLSRPNGRPTPPPSAMQRKIKKPSVDPFARRKPPPKPQMGRPPKGQTAAIAKICAPSVGGELTAGSEQKSNAGLKALEERRKQFGGWSDAPPPGVQVGEFKLVTTKKNLLDGIRYHLMRFNRSTEERGEVDPTKQEQFPRPVSLHRRDPRMPPVGKLVPKEQESVPVNAEEDAELERQQKIKADRDAQRAAEQAQIAPVLKPSEPKVKKNKKEKAFAWSSQDSESNRKQRGVKYEETLPWHIEDADGKSVWVGSYIAALSEVNCAFYIEDGVFKMLPLERYYKFDEKPSFITMTLEEAEKAMMQEGKMSRWMMMDKSKKEEKAAKDEYRTYLGGRPRVKQESSTSRATHRSERQDDYDLDVDVDEFQDDDETAGFEADDEDVRESKDRVRRDHLSANHFGEGDEDEVEKEQKLEKLEKKARKMLGKQTVRGLTKHEHALDYADAANSEDDDNNPFTDSSESESEEEEEDKKDEEKKADSKDVPASGTSTKGSHSVSGAKKVADSLKKGKSLKRPGSPNLSESSGNESSRRKKAKTGSVVKAPLASPTAALGQSRSTTPLPPGRAKGGAAASDGEGSDAGRKIKATKLRASAAGTPAGSRAGSPAPPPTDSLLPANKSSSPNPGKPAAGGTPANRIQPQELIDAVRAYPQGIKIGNFMRIFKDRIDAPGHLTRQEWVQMVKQVCSFGADKLLRPKD